MRTHPEICEECGAGPAIVGFGGDVPRWLCQPCFEQALIHARQVVRTISQAFERTDR